jgi:hypothetical protein
MAVHLALNSALVRARDRLLHVVDRAAAFPHLVRVIFWALLAVVTAGALLDYGAWTREESFSGPFRSSDQWPGRYAVNIGAGIPFWLGLRLIQVVPGHGSTLMGPRLLLDGRDIGLPKTPRPEIAQGPARWLGARERELSFALPNGVSNDSRLLLSVSYVVRFHSTFYDVACWGFGLIALLRLVLARRWIGRILSPADGPITGLLYRYAPYLLAFFPLTSAGVIAACAAYATTIAYGIYAGYALPTTAVFHLGSSDLLANIEPYFPPAILVFAAMGTGFAWAATLGIVPLKSHQRMERHLAHIWAWWGLPVILCLFLFSLSAGGWSGHIRAQDQNYQSLAGLIPHSDARAFFTDVYRQAFWGEWDVLGSRRPVGEAFRELTVFVARYSYIDTLLVQLGLIAGALFLASRTVARHYGIWAAIAFVGSIYITTRSFLYTTLSEPLALIWTLFSVVFLIEAFRLNPLSHALIALAGLTFALATRTGSLLTVPFMMLWITISFATRPRARLWVFTLTCGVVLSVVVLNGLLGWLYAAQNVDPGANFAWTACGLSLGTDWTGCREAYQAQLRLLPHERAQTMFLFAQTWENILEDPVVFLAALAHNFWQYFKNLPSFLFEGYSPGYHVSSAFARIAILVLLACLFLVHRSQSFRTERLFWSFLFISVFLSASIVLGGDGWRVLHVTHALIACFFAAGFTAPAVVAAGATPAWRWQTGATIIAAMTVLFFVIPALSHALAREFAVRSAAVSQPDQHIVVGGRHIAGFLVIPDHEPNPLSLPALHFSQFIELFRSSYWESDFGPINDRPPTPPFAFMMGLGPGSRFGGNIYVAPPAVLQMPHVCAWKFSVQNRGSGASHSVIFFDVTAAEELPRAAHADLCPLWM